MKRKLYEKKEEFSKTEEEKDELIEKKEYEVRILNKIFENLEEKKYELEVISSHMYTLSQICDNTEKENIADCIEINKKIMKKIQKIKEQLKIYDEDNVIDNNLSLDDKDIIDELSDYKKFIENHISFKEEYSKIESYAVILEEIDKINNQCIEFEKKKQKEMEKLEITEEELIYYEEKLMLEESNMVLFIDMINDSGKLIDQLNDKVDDIESKVISVYNYDLLEKLISLELKYLLLIGLSPLKGALPLIAISAKNIKDTIDYLSGQKLVRKIEKTEYFVNDYRNVIENSLNKLNNIKETLSDSLEVISNVKESFNSDGTLLANPKYKTFLKKINAFEDIVKSNLGRINIYEIKMKNNRKKNEQSLEKVLELNQN